MAFARRIAYTSRTEHLWVADRDSPRKIPIHRVLKYCLDSQKKISSLSTGPQYPTDFSAGQRVHATRHTFTHTGARTGQLTSKRDIQVRQNRSGSSGTSQSAGPAF